MGSSACDPLYRNDATWHDASEHHTRKHRARGQDARYFTTPVAAACQRPPPPPGSVGRSLDVWAIAIYRYTTETAHRGRRAAPSVRPAGGPTIEENTDAQTPTIRRDHGRPWVPRPGRPGRPLRRRP